MLRQMIFLMVLTSPVLAMGTQKQALIDLEMGNYFFQGKDFENAKTYYEKADKHLEQDELKVLVCRNLATIHLLDEKKEKASKVLKDCITKTEVEVIETSKAFRDVIKLYAEIKADEINPDIQNAKMAAMRRKQQMMQQRMRKNSSAPKKSSAPKEGVKLGF